MLCVPAPVVNSLRLQAVVAAIGPPCGCMDWAGRTNHRLRLKRVSETAARPFSIASGANAPEPHRLFRTRSHQECKLAELTKP